MGGARAPSPRLVLVDGYNVLHAIPRFAPRGGDVARGRLALERWLQAEALRRGVPRVVLVWDGRGAGAFRREGPLRVEDTPAGTSADARLLELAREAADPPRTWVVSSDADVAGPAEQMGLTTLGAMTFYRWWASTDAPPRRRRRNVRGAPRPSASGDPGAEGKPTPTRRDVERMLRELTEAEDA